LAFFTESFLDFFYHVLEKFDFLTHLTGHCPLHHCLEINQQRLSVLLHNILFHFYMFWESSCCKKLKSVPYSIFVYIFKLIFTKLSQPTFEFDNIHKVKHLHFAHLFSKNSLFIKLLKSNFDNLQLSCISCIKLCYLIFFVHKFSHINIGINNFSFPVSEILPFPHFL
jgi:hypothetical protein